MYIINILYVFLLQMDRLTDVLGQRREFVDMFTGVLAAGDAEAKLKVKTFEQLFSEIMSLDHPEVFYRHVSNCELNSGEEEDGTFKVSQRNYHSVQEERHRGQSNHSVGNCILTNKNSHTFSLTWLQLAAVGEKLG